MKKFFFFGSFDPLTRLDFGIVISKMSEDGFSEGIIAIEVDYTKSALFSMRMREEMIEESLKWYDKLHKTDYASRIKVISYSGLPVYKAMKFHADTLITVGNQYKAELNSIIAREQFGYLLDVEDVGFIHGEDYELDETDLSKIVKYLYLHKEYIMLQRYLTPAVHNKLMALALKDEYADCCRGSYISWEDFVKEVGSRNYHNLSHIAYMLNKYRFYKQEVFSKEEHFMNLNFRAAIFFHDYVLGDEEQSFKYSKLSDTAKSLFMATKHGNASPENLGIQEQLIRDLDLAILTDSGLYNDYKSGVRMEYADIADEVYAKERIKVLDALVKEVEAAKNFRDYEKKRACRNIKNEKKELQKQLLKLKVKKIFSSK